MNQESAAAAAKQPQTETFKEHYVYDGKVAKTWGEWMTRTDISSLQKEYDASKEKSADKSADEGYGIMTPVYWVGGILNSIWTGICSIFTSIFSLCGLAGNKEAGEQGQQPADAPKAAENK